ncbi:hypothetical protein GQ600_13493 [Phytophthora cactorum]|nr:hypothetical protein GQ600_13493 [Phytophthora cactorum]
MPNENVANVEVGALPPASSHVNEKATSGSRNLMPSSYSPEALVSGQFGDIIAVTSGDNTTDVTVAQYIEETYAFRPNRKYNFMVDLVVIWAWCSYLLPHTQVCEPPQEISAVSLEVVVL